MEWVELCNNALFKDLPYKVQTDKWGNIVMSPATNKHGIYLAKMTVLLSQLVDKGTLIIGCSIQTSDGVKVADVAWASPEFMRRIGEKDPFDQAPDICIEILSPSNTIKEMDQKKDLYFAKGAQEVWVCDHTGALRFYKNCGTVETSAVVENFPKKIGSD